MFTKPRIEKSFNSAGFFQGYIVFTGKLTILRSKNLLKNIDSVKNRFKNSYGFVHFLKSDKEGMIIAISETSTIEKICCNTYKEALRILNKRFL